MRKVYKKTHLSLRAKNLPYIFCGGLGTAVLYQNNLQQNGEPEGRHEKA